MNKNPIKTSLKEDLIRIKGGYRPRNHFIFIYNILQIFFIFNLSITQLWRNLLPSSEDIILEKPLSEVVEDQRKIILEKPLSEVVEDQRKIFTTKS